MLRASRTSWVERQPAERVEHDPTRLAGHPGGPARSAAGRRPARCRSRRRPRRIRRASDGRARGWARPRSTSSRRWVATLPSSVIADLNSTQGRPVRACLRNGWLSRRARSARSPSATTISTPSSRRIPRPRPEACSDGSSEATTTRRIPARRIASVHGGVRPWWRTAPATRTSSRRPGPVPRGADRLDLGVRAAELAVIALAERSVAVGDHGADQRVGADPAAPLLGDLDRPRQVAAIGIGGGRHLRFGA